MSDTCRIVRELARAMAIHLHDPAGPRQALRYGHGRGGGAGEMTNFGSAAVREAMEDRGRGEAGEEGAATGPLVWLAASPKGTGLPKLRIRPLHIGHEIE